MLNNTNFFRDEYKQFQQKQIKKEIGREYHPDDDFWYMNKK